MAFAYAHSGTLTGFVSGTSYRICIAQGEPSQNIEIFPVTQSGNGQAAVHEGSRRFTYGLRGRGWYQTSADSGSTWSYVHNTANMASLSGNLFGKIGLVVVQRDNRLFDVTSSTDAVPQKVFETGVKVYSGSLRGHLQSSETPLDADHNTSPATLVIPLGSNTLSGSAVVERVGIAPDYDGGGPTPVDYTFKYSGTVTNTSTPFTLDSWSASIDLDNGETMAGTLVLSSLRADLDYRRGGPVPFTFSGVMSGEVTFT